MSAKGRISFEDMVKLPRTMSKGMAKEMERAVHKIGLYLLSEAIQFSNAAKLKDDTKLFRKSWKVVEFGRSIQLVNTAPYAAAIELGSKYPGKGPPIAALIPWVRRRLPGVRAIQRRRIAFAIAKKIKRDGIPGKFILEDTLKYSGDVITDILDAALAKSVK